jgi:hypothetical protein
VEWLAGSLNSLRGIVFVIDNDRLESLSGRARIEISGEVPGMFIMVGESVSGRYCGTLGIGSRVDEWRAEEDEGPCRWYLLAWPE